MKLKEQFSKHITLEPTDIEISSLDELFLKKAITLVEDNLTNAQLNREFLAKSMAVSSSSLYRKLKSLTGFTTNAFVRSIRLKRAAQMMRNSDYNISDIAYQVGFNDLKYFRTSFKNQFGMNPSEFLQKGSQSNQDLDAEHAI
jgi:AraC-like DNA-binding protein